MKNRTYKKEGKTFLKIIYSLSTLLSLCCFFISIPNIFNNKLHALELFSAGFVLSDGRIENSSTTFLEDSDNNSIERPLDMDAQNSAQSAKGNDLSQNIITSKDSTPLNDLLDNAINFSIPHDSNESTHQIIETQFGASGTKFENFCFNNKTNREINIGNELNSSPEISIKKDSSPEVLIVHTHTCESFMDKDQGFYYNSFYPRTENRNYNIVQVGKSIMHSLVSNGIGVVHDISYHDTPSFSGSYKRSSETIDRNLEKFPSIKVILDIHRDSIDSGGKKIKPTFTFNGRKGAQIMILSGYDADGSKGFPDWEYNLRFALKLQKTAETLYPGITRPLCFGNFRYNMYKTHASTLIEVGSEANTLAEAVYTGALVGDALAKVLSTLAK